ncbi:MAG: HPr family phosphocarrier protein [Deltaproteobacteria bacterium]|jgi:phosphotransferase system HPr (HPr) family protein|nr:HPr family phosphocarrier protein [Deltaproteobacteria bacterium]
MIESNMTVQNASGLHARPASEFIALANKFKESNITVTHGGKEVNGKSILHLLTLGVGPGSEITVKVEGGAEEDVLSELIRFLKELKD